jgi:hypothetical protein
MTEVIIAGAAGEGGGAHIQVLSELSGEYGLHIAAFADPAGGLEFRSFGEESNIPVYKNVGSALALHKADVVVIATPAPLHAEVSHEVFQSDHRPAHLLVEKPTAFTLAEAESVYNDAPPEACVETLYHFADSPEVLWVAENLRGWIEQHGSIKSFSALFADPLNSASTPEMRQALGSSLVDLSSDALSVFFRLIHPDEILRTELIRNKETNVYNLVFDFTMGNDPATCMIDTRWNMASTYITTMKFADGATLTLDHYKVQGFLQNSAGNYLDVLRTEIGPDRRRWKHYDTMYRRIFDRLLKGAADYSISKADSLRINQLLFTDSP